MPLNIIVTAKLVMDPELPASVFQVDRAAKRIVTPGTQIPIPPVINGYDENAIEAALRIKDARDDVTVNVVSLGASFTMDVMKKALSMGADALFLIQDPSFDNLSDSSIIAKVLAAAIRKIGEFNLILCGRQASDWDNAMVPLGIAELLGLPCIAITQRVEAQDGKLLCRTVLPDGYEVREAPLPALATVSNELGQPRYPTLRNIMAAARKQPTTWTLADLGLSADQLAPKTSLLDLYIPQKEAECELITGENEEDAGRKLALRLREAKLI